MDVQQFILEQNVERLKQALVTEQDQAIACTMRAQLIADQRALALLLAAQSGVRIGPTPPDQMASDIEALRERLDREFHASAGMCMLLDPGPGLLIIDVNETFERVAMIKRADVVGRPLFEVFPDNAEEVSADGVSALYRSLRAAVETGRSHAMEVQRYDVRDATGAWHERYWLPVNTPIFDSHMRLAFILQQTMPAERP